MNTVENRTKSNKTHTNKRNETRRNSRRMKKKQPMAITHKLRFIFHFLLNLFLVISSPVSIAIHWRNCLWKCGYTQRLSCNNFAERQRRFAVRKLQGKYAFDRKHRWLFRLRVFNSIIAVATKRKWKSFHGEKVLDLMPPIYHLKNTMTCTQFDYNFAKFFHFSLHYNARNCEVEEVVQSPLKQPRCIINIVNIKLCKSLASKETGRSFGRFYGVPFLFVFPILNRCNVFHIFSTQR